jgi:acetoin utilization deacetylase AcuC-like enzyme
VAIAPPPACARCRAPSTLEVKQTRRPGPSGVTCETAPVRAFCHDRVEIPLPPGHRFPASKYRLTREAVECELPHIRLEQAPATSYDELAEVHDPAYVRRVRFGQLDRNEIAALGLPWSPELVLRARHSSGATVAAAAAAVDDGIAANLGGGTHHAGRSFGRGYCVFNDAVLAIAALRRSGILRRVLVVDLDVHQGDGTADLLAGDQEAFLLSVQGGRNYPFRRIPADLDVDLPDGTGDEPYLEALAPALERAIDAARPELVVYDAAADPFAGDRLGRLALTFDGLAARDAHVLDRCRALGVPIVVVLGGGYAVPIEDTVRVHVQTLARAAGYAGAPPLAAYAASHAAPAANSSRA